MRLPFPGRFQQHLKSDGSIRWPKVNCSVSSADTHYASRNTSGLQKSTLSLTTGRHKINS